MKIKKYGVALIVIHLISLTTNGQDTIKLSLQQCETIFLKENLQLIAERMELDIKDAEIRQARLWDNPEITVEHQIINRENTGFVGFTETDNTVFEIEQLLTTAGKRGRTIHLLELEKLQAEHQFDILLREFKRTLRETYFHLAFLNRIEVLYHEQIGALEKILNSFKEQEAQGNIARIEIIRIQSLLLDLEQEYNTLLGDQVETQNALKILLQLQDQLPVPALPGDFATATIQTTALDAAEITEIALSSRSDLKALQAALDASQQLLRVEKANAYPDLGVGLVYDRLDGFTDNYFGVTFNVQIPLWNRNQGNKQLARYQISQAEILATQQKQEIRHEIEQSLKRFERARHLSGRIDESYEQDFATIIEALLKQYHDGEIRLIEFIDFYESFREGVIRNHDIRKEFLRAAEDLNYTVGQDIFQFNF